MPPGFLQFVLYFPHRTVRKDFIIPIKEQTAKAGADSVSSFYFNLIFILLFFCSNLATISVSEKSFANVFFSKRNASLGMIFFSKMFLVIAFCNVFL